MSYSDALKYLYGLGHEVLAAKFGLENITLLLEKLGRPDRAFKSVIVAGTNGKGSVAAMIEAIARGSGHKTGLLTSPHLVKIEERIRVSGEEISQPDFARAVEDVRRASEALLAEKRLSTLPTFFEQITAGALVHFRERGVELAVLEVGLGGRLDATNAVDAILAVVTTIAYDHQDILGNEIGEIAAEKAGVIKPGASVVIGRQLYGDATEVLMRRCLEASAPPVFVNEPTIVKAGDFGRITFDYESAQSMYKNVLLGLRGRHQAENAGAAIEAAEILNGLGIKIRRDAIIKGLRGVTWPGRLEFIEDRPHLLLDGAHNPSGARILRSFLDEFWQGPLTLIFGAMADKDVAGMASELFGAAQTIVLTRVRDSRAATNARMGKPALGASRNVIFTETVAQALSWARSVTPPDGLICVAGSLHLVGEVKRLLEDEDEQPPM
ncbi:MAG TPA: folylpolyglutamate synthase/dihydrofolate synthase family protein [Blastocatellia bacterium]|jgi:dihydrofolate synthase/folylpolyglutamate synthase|nr:folylpolyglutamate synthase/dihydrofolate synthase family protein [Blastocatellia bacterium]